MRRRLAISGADVDIVIGWGRCLDLIGPALGETDSDKLMEWQGVGWIY